MLQFGKKIADAIDAKKFSEQSEVNNHSNFNNFKNTCIHHRFICSVLICYFYNASISTCTGEKGIKERKEEKEVRLGVSSNTCIIVLYMTFQGSVLSHQEVSTTCIVHVLTCSGLITFTSQGFLVHSTPHESLADLITKIQ